MTFQPHSPISRCINGERGQWEENIFKRALALEKKKIVLRRPRLLGLAEEGLYLFGQKYHEEAPTRTPGESGSSGKWFMRCPWTWVSGHALHTAAAGVSASPRACRWLLRRLHTVPIFWQMSAPWGTQEHLVSTRAKHAPDPLYHHFPDFE